MDRNCPECGRELFGNWQLFNGACTRHANTVKADRRRPAREPATFTNDSDRVRWRRSQAGLYFADEEVANKQRYFLAAKQLNRIAAGFAARRMQAATEQVTRDLSRVNRRLSEG